MSTTTVTGRTTRMVSIVKHDTVGKAFEYANSFLKREMWEVRPNDEGTYQVHVLNVRPTTRYGRPTNRSKR